MLHLPTERRGCEHRVLLGKAIRMTEAHPPHANRLALGVSRPLRFEKACNWAKATASGGAGRQAECVLHGSSLAGIRDSPGAPSPAATHRGLFGNPHQQRQREQLNGQIPQIKRGVALVFTDPGARSKCTWKMLFKYYGREITMTNSPGSASGDQKPNTPANPQQNQANPPKPAEKPAEQQK
jgi:hypothetical protein